ncbi:MAG TPA: hypothetical protein VJT69_11875 [Pyrinomonadaceae bacterium]|nr:hypothetical protein [Pyrinomonadaceae bacterium]
MRIIIEMDPPRPAVERGYSTEEEIRENQRLNRLQRERDERAHRNDNSTSSNGQVTQDKDKS